MARRCLSCGFLSENQALRCACCAALIEGKKDEPDGEEYRYEPIAGVPFEMKGKHLLPDDSVKVRLKRADREVRGKVDLASNKNVLYVNREGKSRVQISPEDIEWVEIEALADSVVPLEARIPLRSESPRINAWIEGGAQGAFPHRYDHRNSPSAVVKFEKGMEEEILRLFEEPVGLDCPYLYRIEPDGVLIAETNEEELVLWKTRAPETYLGFDPRKSVIEHLNAVARRAQTIAESTPAGWDFYSPPSSLRNPRGPTPGAPKAVYGGFRIRIKGRDQDVVPKDREASIAAKRVSRRGLARRIAAAKKWHQSSMGLRYHRAMGRYNQGELKTSPKETLESRAFSNGLDLFFGDLRLFALAPNLTEARLADSSDLLAQATPTGSPRTPPSESPARSPSRGEGASDSGGGALGAGAHECYESPKKSEKFDPAGASPESPLTREAASAGPRNTDTCDPSQKPPVHVKAVEEGFSCVQAYSEDGLGEANAEVHIRLLPQDWQKIIGKKAVSPRETMVAYLKRLPQFAHMENWWVDYKEDLKWLVVGVPVSQYKTAKKMLEPLIGKVLEAVEEGKEYVLWGLPKGKTDPLYQEILYTQGKDVKDVERVKTLAAKKGYHSFRVQVLDISQPWDAAKAFRKAAGSKESVQEGRMTDVKFPDQAKADLFLKDVDEYDVSTLDGDDGLVTLGYMRADEEPKIMALVQHYGGKVVKECAEGLGSNRAEWGRKQDRLMMYRQALLALGSNLKDVMAKTKGYDRKTLAELETLLYKASAECRKKGIWKEGLDEGRAHEDMWSGLIRDFMYTKGDTAFTKEEIWSGTLKTAGLEAKGRPGKNAEWRGWFDKAFASLVKEGYFVRKGIKYAWEANVGESEGGALPPGFTGFDEPAGPSAQKGPDGILSGAKRGDIFSVGNRKWIVFKPSGGHHAAVYAVGSKYQKMYEILMSGKGDGTGEVWQTGGSGQRVGSSPVAVGKVAHAGTGTVHAGESVGEGEEGVYWTVAFSPENYAQMKTGDAVKIGYDLAKALKASSYDFTRWTKTIDFDDEKTAREALAQLHAKKIAATLHKDDGRHVVQVECLAERYLTLTDLKMFSPKEVAEGQSLETFVGMVRDQLKKEYGVETGKPESKTDLHDQYKVVLPAGSSELWFRCAPDGSLAVDWIAKGKAKGTVRIKKPLCHLRTSAAIANQFDVWEGAVKIAEAFLLNDGTGAVLQERHVDDPKVEDNAVQWADHGEGVYTPAPKVVKSLPPGFYEVARSMSGILFIRKSIKTEALIKFEDSDSGKVIDEIVKFWALEGKFKESGTPYKRGLILYGPPGSGKTCTIMQVIEDLVEKRGGVVLEFSEPSCFLSGYTLLRRIHPDMPVVALMEDLDAIVRRCDESALLNLLDGMNDIHKVVFLATTNYPEKLGSRVMDRPSRFDRKFFIGMPSAKMREAYIRNKMKTLGEVKDEAVKRWVDDTDGMSLAHVKELFIATSVMGEPYEQALDTVRKMREAHSSADFDDYEIKRLQKYPSTLKMMGESVEGRKTEAAQAIVVGVPWTKIRDALAKAPVKTDEHRDLLGTVEGVKVYAVDGDWVKTTYNMDFVEGGHDGRYAWIPLGEVWIDRRMHKEDWKYIALHELVERWLMFERGMAYEPAHEIANAVEKRVRQGLASEASLNEDGEPGQKPGQRVHVYKFSRQPGMAGEKGQGDYWAKMAMQAVEKQAKWQRVYRKGDCIFVDYGGKTPQDQKKIADTIRGHGAHLDRLETPQGKIISRSSEYGESFKRAEPVSLAEYLKEAPGFVGTGKPYTGEGEILVHRVDCPVTESEFNLEEIEALCTRLYSMIDAKQPIVSIVKAATDAAAVVKGWADNFRGGIKQGILRTAEAFLSVADKARLTELHSDLRPKCAALIVAVTDLRGEIAQADASTLGVVAIKSESGKDGKGKTDEPQPGVKRTKTKDGVKVEINQVAMNILGLQ